MTNVAWHGRCRAKEMMSVGTAVNNESRNALRHLQAHSYTINMEQYIVSTVTRACTVTQKTCNSVE